MVKKATDFEKSDATILKKANVVNDLVTGGIDVPLSAEQGKALSQDAEILKTDNTTNKTDITLLPKRSQRHLKNTKKEFTYTKSEINRLSSDVIEVAGEVKKILCDERCGT